MRLRCCRLAAVALLALPLSACLVNSRKAEGGSGKQVSGATFSRIEPGVTTKKWILGTLGEPTTQTTLDDGTELWKWAYTNVKTSSGTVLFLFGGSEVKSEAGSTYVEMRNDVVTRAWRTEE